MVVLGDGRRREGDIVLDLVPERIGGRNAHVLAGDEERRLPAGGLVGRPGLAGLIGAQSDGDDVVGLDPRGGERVQRAQDTLIVAAEDDPVGHVGMRRDDRAGRGLRRGRLPLVGDRIDAGGSDPARRDLRLLGGGAVVAHGERLDSTDSTPTFLPEVTQPAAVQQLGRFVADLAAHVRAA